MSAKCEECSMDLFQKNTGEYFCVYCSNSQEIADLHNQLSEKEAECERMRKALEKISETGYSSTESSFIAQEALNPQKGGEK